MKPVGLVDQGFLWLERRNQPMHVAGLQLLRPADDDPDFVDRTVKLALEATRAQPPFNQRLLRRGGMWFWEIDRDFDVESHFHHLALPRPGRIRELLALVSKLHGNLMDRTKPLWELYLISGLEDGRVALYSKIHHALVDGVAANRMLLRQMSESPDQRSLTPLWATERKKKDAEAEGARTGPFAVMAQAVGMAREQIGTLPGVAREVLRTIRARKDPDQVSAFSAPRSILNQHISGARRFAAQSYSFKRMRAAGKALGATVNDITLAMCAGALRRYLEELDALPDKPLIAMVPVSTRKDDSESGNQVAMVLTSLATDVADPGERFAAIMRSMKTAKERLARMSQLEMMNYLGVIMAPSGINMATGLAPTWQAFNVVVSNVPGPKKALYFNGARMEGTYPLSIVLDGQALNITLTSYGDDMEIGLTACRRTLPHMQKLLQYLEDELGELESLAAKAT
ncbi:MAG: WS/DGAT/MGAT family O-acyltransferase [Gammaproteobacteria bacterium]